jgi:ribosomal protein S18 acetylase RimI-like enzyme
MPRLQAVTVEPLSADLVTLAQCMAIDADAFPYDSVRFAFAAKEASARALVARDPDGGRVVGFFAGYLRSRVLHVYGVAVDRGARRSGVGRALVREAVHRARAERVREMTLQVSTANAAAIALYRSEGFTVRKRYPGYYPSGTFDERGDAYEMVLAIA